MREDLIDAHVRKLELQEREFIVEKPKLASEETLKQNGLTSERVKKLCSDGWDAYEYKWRDMKVNEWNDIVEKYGGVISGGNFQEIRIE